MQTNRVIKVLSRRTKNNPVLVGEPGVGKAKVLRWMREAGCAVARVCVVGASADKEFQLLKSRKRRNVSTTRAFGNQSSYSEPRPASPADPWAEIGVQYKS